LKSGPTNAHPPRGDTNGTDDSDGTDGTDGERGVAARRPRGSPG
jgi:hypothetical protein